jgi:hypothetical protein
VTILWDFETLLEFVANEGRASPGKYFLVPQRTLDKLNALMSCPVGHQQRHSGQLDMFAQSHTGCETLDESRFVEPS